MAENEREITTVFKADISNFTAATQQLNRDVALVNSEFKNATASMGKWSDNTDGLKAKITQLNGTLDAEKKRLALLEAQYKELKDAGKENTAEAQRLAIAINNQSAKVKTTQKQIDIYTSKLDELESTSKDAKQSVDDLTQSAEKQGSTFKSIAGGLGKGLVAGIAGVATAATGAVTGFLALGESTREYRVGLAQLETAFGRLGFTAEDTYQAMNYFGSVLGDTKKAQETMLVLGQLVDTEKELESWTDTLTGVYATYGEAIPLESMSEALVLASKQAVAEGGLADALEWGGVNLEEFNEKLESLNSEEERSAYIQKTLNGLYGEAAETYKELNKDALAASTASTNLQHAMAQLGAIAEPILTMLKEATAAFIMTLEPAVKLIGEGLQGVFNGTAGAAETLATGLNDLFKTILDKATTFIPTVVDIIAELLPQIITTILNALPQLVNTLATVITQLLNALSEMLPTLIPVIVNAILLVVETILDNLDLIIDAGINVILALAEGIINALPQLIDKIPIIIDKLVNAIMQNLPKLIRAGLQLILSLGQGLLDAVPQLVAQLPQIIGSIVKGLLEGLPDLIAAGGELLAGLFKGLLDPKVIWENIKNLGNSIIDGFKSFFGIKSPSKLMRTAIGKNLGEGVGVGLIDSEKDVQKNIAKFNKGILKSFNYSLTPNINTPALAAGGIVTSPTLAMIGEAGKEAVVPLENNNEWLDKLADKLASKMGRNTVNNFNYTFEKMETTKLALHKAQLETKRIIGG